MTFVFSWLERITGGRLHPNRRRPVPVPRSATARRVPERRSVGVERLEDRTVLSHGIGLLQTLAAPGYGSIEVIEFDHLGRQYRAGSFDGSVDFDHGPGITFLTPSGHDGYIARYTPAGDLDWVKPFTGTGECEISDIHVDGSGDLFIAGVFAGNIDLDPGIGTALRSSASGTPDGFLVKLNAAGDYQWGIQVGAEDVDQFFELEGDGFGGVWTGGLFGNTVQFGGPNGQRSTPLGTNPFLARYSAAGIPITLHTFGNADNAKERITDVEVLNDGRVAVVGWFSGSVDFDPSALTFTMTADNTLSSFVSIFDWDGVFQHAFKAPGANSLSSFGREAPDLLLAEDAAGNLVTLSSFVGIVDSDPGPGTRPLISVGEKDLAIAKYRPTGELLWSRRIGGTSLESAYDLLVDDRDRIHLLGFCPSPSIDLDPGPGEKVFANWPGTGFGFHLTLDGAGNYLAADAYEPSPDAMSRAFDMQISPAGDLHVVGTIAGTARFSHGGESIFRTSAGGADGFLFKYAERDDLLVRSATGQWSQTSISTNGWSQRTIGTWNPDAGWRDVRHGDFSGDGIADVLGRTASGEWWLGQQGPTGHLGDRPFGAWNEAANWRDVQVGEFNRDGRLDILARTAQGVWHLGRNHGAGFTFVVAGAWNPQATWRDVQTADMNGDGWLDLIGRTSQGAWWVGLGGASGLFANAFWSSWNEGGGWADVRILDMTGDGRPDVIGRTGGGWWVGRNTVTNPIRFGESNFDYTNWVNWNPAANWRDTQFADFNGDGRIDLGARTGVGQWYVFLNNAGLSFVFPTGFWTVWNEAANWVGVRSGDVDGDGRADLVGRASDGNWYLARSTGSAFQTSGFGGLSGEIFDPQLTPFDGRR